MLNLNVKGITWVTVLVGCVCVMSIPLFSNAQLAPGPAPAGQQTITNPLGSVNTISGLLQRLIKGVLTFVGLLALLAMIWGGGGIITAFGDEEKMKAGKTIIIQASIGLMAVMAAYAVITAVQLLIGV